MGVVQNLKMFIWNILNTQIRDFWKIRTLFYAEEIILTTWPTVTVSKISVDIPGQGQHIEFFILYFFQSVLWRKSLLGQGNPQNLKW